MTVITMYKDGREIPVSSHPESIQRMKDSGWSESKAVKRTAKKQKPKAEDKEA